MRISFFGRLRDGPPPDAVPIAIRDTAALKEWLGRDRPELLDSSIRIAVNDELIVGDRSLREGDEIAFLPPMSGG